MTDRDQAKGEEYKKWQGIKDQKTDYQGVKE